MPGKSRKANAYAASKLVTITPIVTATATITLLNISRPRSPILHAARSVSSVKLIGSNDFGWSIASGPLFSACINVA